MASGPYAVGAWLHGVAPGNCGATADWLHKGVEQIVARPTAGRASVGHSGFGEDTVGKGRCRRVVGSIERRGPFDRSPGASSSPGGGGVASSGGLAPYNAHAVARHAQVHVRRQVLRPRRLRPGDVFER